MYSVKGVVQTLLYERGGLLIYGRNDMAHRGGNLMSNISYSRHGDYFLPDITLRDLPPVGAEGYVEPLGRYARMRRAYLREHRTIYYNTLLLSEQLFSHLRKVDDEANRRLEAIMADILVFNPPPDKADDGFAWAAHMTAIRASAERMMLDEVVYD